MRVVGKHGQTSIVEYEENGLLKRCLLPKSIIRQYGNSIPLEIVERGIDVGIEVEEAFAGLELPSTAELLNHVRREGFWTRNDVLGNVSRFKLVLATAIGDQVEKVLMGSR